MATVCSCSCLKFIIFDTEVSDSLMFEHFGNWSDLIDFWFLEFSQLFSFMVDQQIFWTGQNGKTGLTVAECVTVTYIQKSSFSKLELFPTCTGWRMGSQCSLQSTRTQRSFSFLFLFFSVCREKREEAVLWCHEMINSISVCILRYKLYISPYGKFII